MSTHENGIAFDLELRSRLKEVRDHEPRPDHARLVGLRELALRKALLRRWFKTTTAALTATTAILAGIVLPTAFTPTDHSTHPAWVAQVDQGLPKPDPWVGASTERTAIEGDGWIPRHGSPTV